MELVLAAEPDTEFRVIIGLARYAGLRTPSETLLLRWPDIDFAAGRMVIHSPKLEAYEDKEYRVIPLWPEIRRDLEVLHDRAEPGAVYVITRHRPANCDPASVATPNWRTRLKRLLKRAGVPSWPKLFVNLRASHRVEVEEQWPRHVADAWLGHDSDTADKHYLMPTPEHFDRAMGPKVAPQVAPFRSASKCDEAREQSAPIEMPRNTHVALGHTTSRTARYPHGESNPGFRTENPTSWATRRWGLICSRRERPFAERKATLFADQHSKFYGCILDCQRFALGWLVRA